MINQKRLVSTFKKLVIIDSPSLQEGKMVKFLQKEIKKLGYKYEVAGRPAGGEVGNLIIEVPGSGKEKPLILLNSHIDTVAPGTNIKPIERKGYIYSDGTTILGADNKAGTSVILELLRMLKEQKLSHPPLRVVFTVAEEIGLFGAKVLPEKFLKADFGITMDGGDVEEIIYQAPSQYNLKAKIIGRAAHAGIHPEKGINAIKIASVAIAKMKIGRIDKETTANIGVIKGGKATNIIPDEVELKGEARSLSFNKLQRQINHMRKVLLQICARYKAKIKLDINLAYSSFEIKKSAKVLRLAQTALKRTGIKPILKKTGGGSDANIFNAAGLPTVIMGAGADRVHTYAERVAIKDMLAGLTNLLNLLQGV